MKTLASAAATALVLMMTSAPGATAVTCPRGLQPLGANALAPATSAALAAEDLKSKPLVVAAALASADPDRGPQARRECGAAVWRRTVVVHIRLLAFSHSASLSERVDFVGRFRSGWRVWQIVH